MSVNFGVKGTDLQFTITPGSSVLTSVGQVINIDGPPMKMGKRDATHLLSATKEYESTIGDPGEYNCTLLYDAANPAAIAFINRVTTPTTVQGGDDIKVIFPSTTRFFKHQGFVSAATPKGGDVEGTWMMDCSVQVTRAITYPTTV